MARTRREVLRWGTLGVVGAALAPAALVGCTSGDTTPEPSGPPTDPVADAALRADVVAAESALVARYERALATASLDESTRSVLVSIRDEHAAHRDAVAAQGGSTGTRTGAPPAPTGVAGLRGLVAAERLAAQERATACSAAGDPDLSRLLALIGASEASHVAALRAGVVT